MNCPNCDKSIPNESIFCLYCGEKIETTTVNNVLNSRPPVAISQLLIWFESGMEQKEIKGLFGPVSLSSFVLRNFTFAFQLLDGKHESTSFDGQVKFLMDWKQYKYYTFNNRAGSGADLQRKGIIKKDNEWAVTTRDFFRAKDSQLYCKITYPKPLEIFTQYNVEGNLYLYFVPKGNSKKLYLTNSFSLSPTS